MTDTYHAPPTAPEPHHPDDEPPTDAERDPRAEDDAVVKAEQEGDAANDRHVWTPPAPQYPARPTQQPPAQYQSPQPQAAPQYVPQGYAPPQGQPNYAPAPSYPPPPAQPQLPQYTQAYALYPATGAVPPQTFVPPAPVRVSKARLGRRLARQAVRGGGAIGKVMFGVRPLLTVATLILLVLAGMLAYDKWLAPKPAPPNLAKTGGTVQLLPAPQSVQSYLDGTQKGDADKVWNALSPSERTSRVGSGADKTVLSTVLQAEQSHNLSYSTIRYVGSADGKGSPDPDRQGGYYFYVGDVTTSQGNISVPIVFTVDNKGQVSNVDDFLYRQMLTQLSKGQP